MKSLPLFHRVAGQKVIVLGEGALAEPRRRLVEQAGAIIVGEDDGEARLAFVALDEPDEAAARLKARGLLVNVTDRPELCDFTMPSLLERGPVQVAIGTGGASAGLAKHLRLRIEALLPASLGALAEALQAARGRLRERFPDAAERRRLLDAALAAGGALDPLDEGSADAVDAWLQGGIYPAQTERVVIALASDDPEDLTLREARLLGCADMLLVGAGVAPAILARARADALRRDLPFEGEVPDGLVVELRRS